MMKPGAEWVFHLTGGCLCLDLANTVSWRRSGHPIERLARYADLLAWGRQACALTEREARGVALEAKRRPAEAERVLARVITVREAIYGIFAGLAHGRAPAAADLAVLNARLEESLTHLTVKEQKEGFAWAWSPPDALDRMAWPAVRSAAELLTSDDLRDLRTCGAANCGWVFLDTTKNRSRRWCDMRVCGNRAKVRRYYARHREA